MLKTFLSVLKGQSGSDSASTKRRHARRSCDACVGVINGRTYPVENWSMGGLLIGCDERTFSIGSVHEVVLKFKLQDTILDVPHTGRVIRKARDKIALEFEPLSRAVSSKFQQVVDDYVASRFAESQSW